MKIRGRKKNVSPFSNLLDNNGLFYKREYGMVNEECLVNNPMLETLLESMVPNSKYPEGYIRYLKFLRKKSYKREM